MFPGIYAAVNDEHSSNVEKSMLDKAVPILTSVGFFSQVLPLLIPLFSIVAESRFPDQLYADIVPSSKYTLV